MTGFVAQDVEKAANTIKYDFSSIMKPKNENQVYSLRFSNFVVSLIKAVQKQQAMIENHQKQITELVKRIDVWEKK